MSQEKKSKLINMVIAMVISISLWAYCVVEINPTSDVVIKNIPIAYEGESELEDAGLAIISDKPESINLTLGGQRSVLNKIKADDFMVRCDLSTLMEGENRLSLSIISPDGVDIEKQSIKNIVLVVENIVTESRAIIGYVANQDADEDKAEILSISRSKVKVTGAESRVEDVSYVRAVVDATMLGNTAVILDCPLEAIDGNGDIVEEVTLGRAYITCKAVLKSRYSFVIDKQGDNTTDGDSSDAASDSESTSDTVTKSTDSTGDVSDGDDVSTLDEEDKDAGSGSDEDKNSEVTDEDDESGEISDTESEDDVESSAEETGDDDKDDIDDKTQTESVESSQTVNPDENIN